MDDERRKSIGATIRTLREARGQSRQELAAMAGISLEMLAKVEQGRKAPSAATLTSLAKGLGIDTPDLAHRASAWQAFASAGASAATLRTGTIAGTLGVDGRTIARTLGIRGARGIGPGVVAGAGLVAPVAVVTAAGVAAVQRERRNRRVLELLLRTEELELSNDDIHELAEQLGVDIPDDELPGDELDESLVGLPVEVPNDTAAAEDRRSGLPGESRGDIEED